MDKPTANMAAREAGALWSTARRAERDHAYLVEHRIPALRLRQSRRGELLLPLCRAGVLVGLQLRPAQLGRSVAMIGGDDLDCYAPTAPWVPGQPLIVAEDWPSAVALHLKTGNPTWAAIGGGRLRLNAVAMAARELVGAAGRLIVAGDRQEEGMRAADQAASAAGAEILLPRLPLGAPRWLTTFNDLARWDAGERRAWK
jgi:phage/plasmid primase-like uncharacterized protein